MDVTSWKMDNIFSFGWDAALYHSYVPIYSMYGHMKDYEVARPSYPHLKHPSIARSTCSLARFVKCAGATIILIFILSRRMVILIFDFGSCPIWLKIEPITSWAINNSCNISKTGYVNDDFFCARDTLSHPFLPPFVDDLCILLIWILHDVILDWHQVWFY